MPSRAYTSFLPNRSGYRHLIKSGGFNALSGLYLISTFWRVQRFTHHLCRFQCPLGLIPHFYWDEICRKILICSKFQCPLGLKLLRGNGHKNKKSRRFQCPLGLIPHFYQTARVTGTLSKAEVSMPSRAYTSFLHFGECSGLHIIFVGFNALSGLYLISTESVGYRKRI